jgi:hypothetical protein
MKSQPADFVVGEHVIWSHVPRGGYGYVWSVPATVVRVGRVRVTIDAALDGGGTKRIVVAASSLRR